MVVQRVGPEGSDEEAELHRLEGGAGNDTLTGDANAIHARPVPPFEAPIVPGLLLAAAALATYLL